MKDSENIHKKVQEMCDCYATTDPLKEMSDLIKDPETENAAIKWIALTALHGVNSNAEKITIASGDDGKTTVVAEYRIAELPSPGHEVGRKVFETFRDITHIEAKKGKTAMALGMRDSSIELNIEIKEQSGVGRTCCSRGADFMRSRMANGGDLTPHSRALHASHTGHDQSSCRSF